MAGETTKTPEEIKAQEAETARIAAEEATKAAEAEKNKTVPHQALHAEREEHKKTKERLKALEDAQVEKDKKALEEQGNFKSLYEQEQARAKKLEEDLNGEKTKLTEFEKTIKERLDASLNSIKEPADKKIVEDILSGKSLAEQDKLLPTLLEKFGVPSTINAGPKGGGGKGADDRETKEAQAKKEGDVMGMIKNAPRK